MKPTKYISGNFKNNQDNIVDFQRKFIDNPNIVSDQKLRETLIKLVESDQYGNYVVFEEDIVTGTFTICPRYCKDYKTKHHASECVLLPEDSQLDFFYNWLNKQYIFSDYGRVTFFVNYSGASTLVHKDYHDSDQENSDEFIWISLSPRKNFYLINDLTNEKIYLSGHCNWFNTGNYHGADPVEKACYSIRVDGVFSQSFKDRALN